MISSAIVSDIVVKASSVASSPACPNILKVFDKIPLTPCCTVVLDAEFIILKRSSIGSFSRIRFIPATTTPYVKA